MLKIDELEKELKLGNLASVYLLFGDELFLLESNLKKIKKTFGELVKGINYIILDEESVNNIISDIETPAFGYEKKLIIARNTGLFKMGAKKQKESVSKLKEKLNDYLKDNFEQIKESNVIVFVEEEAGKSSLFNTIEKLGVVCKFEQQKPAQISKRLIGICKAYNIEIDSATAQYLVECC